jgi:RNA polymerase sigma-70 factor (ECF subfamily)
MTPAYPVALVEAAAAGDRDAISALLAAAQPDIRRYARRNCRNASDIEDAVQEAMFILYRRAAILRGVASLAGWLFVVVRRVCLSLAATMKGVPLDVLDAIDPPIAIPEMSTADLRLDLADAIQSLPDNYRSVILLRDVEELTVNEIAERLGLSREAAKGRLHRARAMLREYLIP